jgi:hypothetical protein
MTEIVNLLEKLKQLDEPTYEKIARGIPLQPCGQYMVFDHGEVRACQYHEAYMPFGDLLREVAEAWLQFCIQRAIAAHAGWFAEIGFYEKRAYARISKILENREDEETEEMSLRDGTTPCIALLACYIACLESHP